MSTDWANPGESSGAGLKIGLRYDYLNQNQLRSGTRAISPVAASQILNSGGPQEVEKYTKNNYVTADLDYSPQADWGVYAQLPFISRSHSTLGTASDGVTPGPGGGQYDSKTSSLGDIKFIGRYMGLLPRHNLALQLGLKLPTGSHSLTGTSTDPGVTDPVLIDRGLQPGSGTTDLILGTTYVDALAPGWDYLVQGLYQTALDSRDGYRPGNGLNLNIGLRYTAVASIQPQIQINIRRVQRDSGPNADTVSTGGTLAYLSPGLTAPLSDQAAVYGYAQVPIYQYVNGVQLAPRFTASIGLRYAF